MSNIYKAASSEPGVVYSVTGENGVTASPTTGNVVVSGVNATTSAVGVASFNSADFTVSMAGEVSLAGSGGAPIQTITGNSGSAEVPDSSGNFNILGSGSITVAGTTNTETISLTGLTDHAILVGAGTATITKVGPTVTAGQIFQSQGSSMDPAFSTATYPSTTTINQILYSSSANTVAGLTTANNGVLITGTTGIPSILADGTTGQVLTATTGEPPSWANPATSGTVTSVSVVSANGFAGTVATATTTPAITLSTTITGLLSGNGTAISGSAITQYDVLVGGASNAVSSVGPGTSGQILQSGGNAGNPAYSTSTYPSTNAANTLLYASSANTMAALATANDGVLITSNSGVPSWLANSGTAGYVLTANSGAPPSWQATSQTVTSVATAHSTAQFSLSGTTETVDFGITNLLIGSAGPSITSAIQNVGLGYLALNALSSGSGQVGVGYNSLLVSTGSLNTATGGNTLSTLLSGASNTVYGYSAGSAYTGSESSNILIKNAGSLGESNVIRIGTQGTSAGQQNICYIAGIHGASPVSGNTPQVVVCDSNGNLTPISSSTSGYILTSNGSATPSFQAGGGGFTPVNFSVKLSGNISNVTGDGTNYAILYDTVVFNNGGGTYSSVTGLYTVPTTGIYQINLTHFIFGGSVADTIFLGYLLINGSINVRLMDANPGPLGLSVNGEFMQSATYLYSATAGDTIGAYVDVNGGTKNVGVAGGSESCLFSGFRVA